jgi:hypothetical protein
VAVEVVGGDERFERGEDGTVKVPAFVGAEHAEAF